MDNTTFQDGNVSIEDDATGVVLMANLLSFLNRDLRCIFLSKIHQQRNVLDANVILDLRRHS